MGLKIEGSEKDIEDVLAKNIKHYLGLRFVGRQINTPAGIVDILARSPTNKVYYIIELKRGDVNASAYAQVMRYCHYFNYNKSKNGERIFTPLLIGEHLASEMQKNVQVYEKGGENFSEYCPIPEYTLFQFNPISGLSFSYYNTAQSEYASENFYNEQNYLAKKDETLSYQNYVLTKTLRAMKEKLDGGKSEEPVV